MPYESSSAERHPGDQNIAPYDSNDIHQPLVSQGRIKRHGRGPRAASRHRPHHKELFEKIESSAAFEVFDPHIADVEEEAHDNAQSPDGSGQDEKKKNRKNETASPILTHMAPVSKRTIRFFYTMPM